MAGEAGGDEEHLTFLRAVAQQAHRYGLFAALRAAEARAPRRPRIGLARVPSQNIVDLAQTPTMAFPASTLDRIEIRGGRARVSGYWLGLTGPMGPLPLHLTEFATYERRYSQQRPFGGFLDMLAGRMLQFFYRAWADSSPAAQADRPDDDNFAYYLSALSGGAEGVAADAAFPARARLHYAGLFASHRSAVGIEDALTDLLGLRVRLQEFQPRWRSIEPEDRTRLGAGYCRLGVDAVAGGRVVGVSDAFRIVVQARSLEEFQDFLPGGRRYAVAAEALDAFAPTHLEWDIEIELDEQAVPQAALDGRAQLGWTSWMGPTGRGGVRADTRLGRAARRIARKMGRRTPS